MEKNHDQSFYSRLASGEEIHRKEERGTVAHFRCNGSQHREQFESIAVSKLIS